MLNAVKRPGIGGHDPFAVETGIPFLGQMLRGAQHDKNAGTTAQHHGNSVH
ncbi:MAG TPA: hypothetical protein PKH24_05510 [Sedimentisphaerales bacterium]|jgi:hypothetical protein|nr:hypothetical protein [Sedimentisphaerales bacterium]HNU28993.1 hypothetical protein [Sedimentisphaerales bacterium]